MPDPCIVVIGAHDQLPALKQRAHGTPGEVIAFADTDALRALDVIVQRQPEVVALERLFAATPRGAALIGRIKADPALAHSEIRVIAHDGDYMRVSPRTPAPAATATAEVAPVVSAVIEAPSHPLDQRGTRRARRHRIAEQVDMTLDGSAAAVVDLSVAGAQVLSSNVLKPNQRVRVALHDAAGAVRFNAVVAWASFEIPPKTAPRYRAGLAFVDADATAVDAFCQRHRQ